MTHRIQRGDTDPGPNSPTDRPAVENHGCCMGHVGHLFGICCTSGNVAVLQRGKVGDHSLQHYTSQFVSHLLQSTHIFSKHACAVPCAPLVALLLGSISEHPMGAGSGARRAQGTHYICAQWNVNSMH